MKNIKIIGTVSEIMLNPTCSDIARIIVTGESESALADERGEYMCDIPADIARKLRLNTKVMVYGRVNPEHFRNREREWIVPAHVLELRILGSKEEKCIIGVVGRIDGKLISNPTSDGMVKNFTVRCEGASDMLRGLGIRNGTCLLCEAPGNMADGLKIGDKVIATGIKELNGKFVIEDIDAGIPFQETVSIYSEDIICDIAHFDMKWLVKHLNKWEHGWTTMSNSECSEAAINVMVHAERVRRYIKSISHCNINRGIAVKKLMLADAVIEDSTIPIRTRDYLLVEIDKFYTELIGYVVLDGNDDLIKTKIWENANDIFWRYYEIYLATTGLKRIKDLSNWINERVSLFNHAVKTAISNRPILAERFDYWSKKTSGGPFMEPWPELLKEYRERHW